MDVWVVTRVFGIAVIGVAGIVVAAISPRRRSRASAPEPDPAVQAVLAVLPGANCGVCGNASCFDAALAVAAGSAGTDVCAAGGKRTAEAVTRVLRAAGGPAAARRSAPRV